MSNRTLTEWLATLLASCLILNLGACAVGPATEQDIADSESTEAALTLADYETKDLLMGLVLMDGPVAELVPTIRDNWKAELHASDSELLVARREFASRVLDKLVIEHPTQAEAFRAGVLSGDHLRIQNSIEDAALLVGMVAKSFPEYQERADAAGDDGRGLCLALNVAVAFNFAVAAAVALGIAVVAVSQIYVYSNYRFGGRQPSTEAERASSLLNEQATDEIASMGSPS